MDTVTAIAELIKSLGAQDAVIGVLSILLIIEQLLPQTSKIKANSTFQAITNTAKAVKGKLMPLIALMLICGTVAFIGGGEPAYAEVKIGEDLYIDGQVALGRQWDVDTTGNDINLSSRKNEIIYNGEIGLRHKFARPFVSYTSVTSNYILRSIGSDFALWATEGIGVLGLRTSWNQHRAYGINSRYIYTGIFFKF